MKESQKDKELLERFRFLYKKCAPALILYARKYVGIIVAEDIVQEVFLKIWNKKAFLFMGEGMTTYLYYSVKHACLDYIKHLDVKEHAEKIILNQLKIEELAYSNDDPSQYDHDAQLRSIYREVQKLPERCRKVFIMTYLEERKASEVASLLNISRRTVEAQLYKALRTIRDALLFFTILFF